MKGHCHQRKDRAAMSRKSAPPPGGPLPLVLAALFSGLTAVLSWINVPLFFTPVPVNLALIGPYLAGLLLGVRYGCLSQLLYILLAALVCRSLPASPPEQEFSPDRPAASSPVMSCALRSAAFPPAVLMLLPAAVPMLPALLLPAAGSS